MNFLTRRSIHLLLLSTLVCTIISACHIKIPSTIQSSGLPAQSCRVVQHVTGETCIPIHPQRIVTLWATSLSTCLALGIEPIASTWMPNQPFPKYLGDAADRIEYVGTLAEPNLEKILRLQPDLVISNTRLKNINKELSKIVPTVVLNLPSPPSPLWQEHLGEVAKLLNKELQSERLVKQYWHRVHHLKQLLEEQRRQLKVSVITINPPYGIFAYGQKHPASKVLNDVGLQRPSAQNSNVFTISNISLEQLSDVDGDSIFISYRGGAAAQEAFEELKKNPLWQQLKAVKNNQVYVVDSDHWYAFDVLAMSAVIDDLEKYLVNPS